jgi:DNA-binding protein HU-beta
MNKQEFIDALLSKTEAKRSDAEKFLKGFWLVIEETLAKGGQVNFIGTGIFGTKQRKAQNPKTGEKLVIPETVIPTLKLEIS